MVKCLQAKQHTLKVHAFMAVDCRSSRAKRLEGEWTAFQVESSRTHPNPHVVSAGLGSDKVKYSQEIQTQNGRVG